jgi:hypothetical protein
MVLIYCHAFPLDGSLVLPFFSARWHYFYCHCFPIDGAKLWRDVVASSVASLPDPALKAQDVY